ncbi:MAG: squalene synthase HpnD [Rhodospirillaceae bacterium]|nr:squalene synthase HpnD [Rhodospirillaceae bacterium]|tara:strand:- start:1190 stop:2071 length:882 start_codon:yes stop_codon:yes gene_type:complete
MSYAAINMKSCHALEHVTAIVRNSGTSFYWAMRILPAQKRNAIYAVYAFCREVDDIADNPGTEQEKLQKLEDWRAEIERLFSGKPQLSTSIALMDPIKQFSLCKKSFLAVIEGVENDALASVRMPTFLALEKYCDHVACAVGRLSNQIFGIDKAVGEPVAEALGQALQLTNILRDLYEDAKIDRLYVPTEMLSEYNIPSVDARLAITHPSFPKVCDELASIARIRYQDAEQALDQCDRKTMLPAIMMMQNYQLIFNKLLKRGWTRLKKPVSLHKGQKLWLLMRYMRIYLPVGL